MKNIYKLFITGGFVLITSCSDYLERFPKEGPSSENYPANEKELVAALNGTYKQNTLALSDNMPLNVLLDVCSDIGYDRNTSAMQQIGQGNINADNGFAQAIWKRSYETIGRCNFLLGNMHLAAGTVSEKKMKTIEAEARFVRAFTYMNLSEFYGGVPIVTKMLDLSDLYMPRNTKAEVVDFVIAELEEIKDSFEEGYNGKGRATKGAALALMARTALYNQKWELAASAAQQVMQLGTYDLHDSFPELFLYGGDKTKEVIWAHQYSVSANFTNGLPVNLLSRNGKGYSNKVPSQSLVDSYQCIDGKDIDKSDLYDPAKPYENRDPRLSYTLALPGSVYAGYQFETHRDSVECWDYNVEPAKRVPNTDATNAYASFTGYCWRKYIDMADMALPGQSEISISIIRYAEVLLTYAEAKIEANQIDQSVYDAINKVRQRKTVEMPTLPEGLTKEQLLSAVRKERLYELAGEGFRLFDIKRWKIADKVMAGPFYGRIQKGLLNAAPEIDEFGVPDYSVVPNHTEMRIVEQRTFQAKYYLWPIPEKELTANPLMEQNPGY